MREEITVYIENTINLKTKKVLTSLLHIPNDLSKEELTGLEKFMGKEICIPQSDKPIEKQKTIGTTDLKMD